MRVLLALGVVLAAGAAQAKNLGGKGPFGLGLALGDPSALTAKFWTGDRFAVQANLSWSFRREWLGLTADYLYHHTDVIPPLARGEIAVPLYVGLGGAFFSDVDADVDADPALGVRVPVGVAFMWRDWPVEAFVEIAPYVFVLPEIEFDLGGVLGGRWYF